MDDHVNECLCHTNTFDEEFLRDILQQPEEPAAPVAAPVVAAAAATSAITGSQITTLGRPAARAGNLMIKNSSSIMPEGKPTTYILSFDKSTALLPTTTVHDPRKEVSQSHQLATNSLLVSSSRPNQGTKKTRSASETLDHIMSERNRRQELTKKFIALSAAIPGLKKVSVSVAQIMCMPCHSSN